MSNQQLGRDIAQYALFLFDNVTKVELYAIYTLACDVFHEDSDKGHKSCLYTLIVAEPLTYR